MRTQQFEYISLCIQESCRHGLQQFKNGSIITLFYSNNVISSSKESLFVSSWAFVQPVI